LDSCSSSRRRSGQRRHVSRQTSGVGGVAFPAAVVSEFELNGYVIERVYDQGRLVGVHLLDPEPRDTPAAHRQHRPHR
jgi:hypothetical protein